MSSSFAQTKTSNNYNNAIGNSNWKKLRKMYRTPPPSLRPTSTASVTPIAKPDNKPTQKIASGDVEDKTGYENKATVSPHPIPNSTTNSSSSPLRSKENKTIINNVNKFQKHGPNDNKIRFTLNTYNNNNSAPNKTTPNQMYMPINTDNTTCHFYAEETPIKQSTAIISMAQYGQPKTSDNNGMETRPTPKPRTIELDKSSQKKAKKSNAKISFHKESTKPLDSPKAPIIRWISAKDDINKKLNALPNVSIAPYNYAKNGNSYQNITINDNYSNSSHENAVHLHSNDSNSASKTRSISLNIKSHKPVENTIKSPGITIREVECLDDISSVELIKRLSVQQLKTIVRNESLEPDDYPKIDQLRNKVDKLWLAKELTKEGRSDICRLCLQKKSDCLLLLCGHQTICMNCSENIYECPVCKAFIVRKVHVYVN